MTATIGGSVRGAEFTSSAFVPDLLAPVFWPLQPLRLLFQDPELALGAMKSITWARKLTRIAAGAVTPVAKRNLTISNAARFGC